MLSEDKIIQSFKKIIPAKFQGNLGIGDDADWICLKSKNLVVSCDAIVDHVDFLSEKHKPFLVGRKALAINLSDMAAMGAKPLAWILTLGFPASTKLNWIQSFFKGAARIAAKYQLKCLGGDLTRASEIMASITILGEPIQGAPIDRSGAKAGDWIGVTGHLGGSILKHHLNFEPRLRESDFLARCARPTSMMDLSDGFAQDLNKLCAASRLGARVELDAVPVSHDALHLHPKNASKALISALQDGEDFELLFTVNSDQKKYLDHVWKTQFPKVNLSWVGRMSVERSIRWFQNGKSVTMPHAKTRGFDHFR